MACRRFRNRTTSTENRKTKKTEYGEPKTNKKIWSSSTAWPALAPIRAADKCFQAGMRIRYISAFSFLSFHSHLVGMEHKQRPSFTLSLFLPNFSRESFLFGKFGNRLIEETAIAPLVVVVVAFLDNCRPISFSFINDFEAVKHFHFKVSHEKKPLERKRSTALKKRSSRRHWRQVFFLFFGDNVTTKLIRNNKFKYELSPKKIVAGGGCDTCYECSSCGGSSSKRSGSSGSTGSSGSHSLATVAAAALLFYQSGKEQRDAKRGGKQKKQRETEKRNEWKKNRSTSFSFSRWLRDRRRRRSRDHAIRRRSRHKPFRFR